MNSFRPALILWFCVVFALWLGFSQVSRAQQPVTNVTTISKVFYTWDYGWTGRNGRNCGYRLTGEWFPPHPDYNQSLLYTLYVKDTQGRDRSLSWWESNPEPGVPFKFDIGGTWISSPFSDANCPQPYATGGMVEWTATLIVPPPNVNFNFREDAQIPGRVHFISFSTDPRGKKMEYQWKFGDGSEDTFVSPIHDYKRPGTNEVVLRVSNPIGAFNLRTNKVVIKAPVLDVSIGYAGRPNKNPKIGETFKVRVRVAATQGFGPLSNVRFDASHALMVPEQFEIVEAPEEIGIGELDPKERVEFIWTLKAVRVGQFDIATAPVVGVDMAGNTVMDQASLPGEISGLNVEVIFPEPPLLLVKKEQRPGELSSNPGYEPGLFPVKVKVSVPANGEPVTNITLQGWAEFEGGLTMDKVRATGNPESPFVMVIPQPVPFPLIVTQKPPAMRIEGPLAPGAPPVEFDFLVQAEVPGTFEFGSLITAGAVRGGVALQERGSGVRSVLGDLVLSVQVALANEPTTIKEGKTVEVYGTVKNLTDNEIIVLDAIHIINLGQGITLGPVYEEEDIPEPGSLGIFGPTLTPDGETKEEKFKARIKTFSFPGIDQSILVSRTIVVLDFAISGEIIGEDGEKREIAPENMVVEWGNGAYEVGGATYLRSIVQPDPLKPRKLEPADFFLRLYGNVVESLVGGGKDGIVGLVQLLGSLPEIAMTAHGFAQAVKAEQSEAYLNSIRYLWVYRQWLVAVRDGVSPETKKAELDAIAEELHAYMGRRQDNLATIKNMVNSSVEGMLSKAMVNANAAYDHDYDFNVETAKVLTDWVRPAAKFVTEEVITDLATGMFLTRIAKSLRAADDIADAARRKADIDAVDVENATLAVARQGDSAHPTLHGSTGDLRKLRGGAKVNQVQATRAFSVDKVTDDNLIRATDVKNGGLPIVVAIRSRADETLEWMRTKLGMTPKPVTIKPKNVDLIDETFLGYRSGSRYGDDELGRGGGDRGSVILAQPLPPHVVQARMAGQPKEVRDAIIERYRTRWEEWYGKESLPADESALPFDTTIYPDSKAQELRNLASERFTGDNVKTRTTLKGTLRVPKRGSVPDPSINADVREKIAGESFETRNLELKQVIEPPDNDLFDGGREYYEVWLEDEVGTTRRVAGDVDVVVVADIAGHQLGLNPLKTGIAEYGNQVARVLQHIMKAQHPWSSSLISDKLRNKYLNDHRWHPDIAKRGEPLLLYYNGERYVGWFHPTKAINPLNPLENFQFLDGGPGSVDDVVRKQVARRQDLPRPTDVAPKLWQNARTAIMEALKRYNVITGDDVLAACAVSVARNAGASIYRLSDQQELQERLPDGSWMVGDPGAACGPEGIIVAPETVISENVQAGATRIPILEQLIGDNWRELFQIGDDIIIGVGTPIKETTTIIGYETPLQSQSLRLTAAGAPMLNTAFRLAIPLRYSHPAGTQVTLVPPRLNASALSAPPLAWFRSDAGVEFDRDNNIINWIDQVNGYELVNPLDGRSGYPHLVESDLGFPVANFASSDWVNGNFNTVLTNATIFTLSRYNTPTSSGNDYIYTIGLPTKSGDLISLARQGTKAYHRDGAIQHFSASGTVTGGVWQVFTQIYGENDPASQQLFLDGVRIMDSKATAPYLVNASVVSLGNYLDGGANWFIGDVAEWIIYDRVLSTPEREEVEFYLIRRAGMFVPMQQTALFLNLQNAGNGVWKISWQGEAGQEYLLEKSLTLLPGSWGIKQSIIPTVTGNVEVDVSAQGPDDHSFYRLRRTAQ
jgi:PKD repeat protein